MVNIQKLSSDISKCKNKWLCFRDDVASRSTFTLEDSAICLTSEQSTMDVDIDRDEGSVLDVYLVSCVSTFDIVRHIVVILRK